MSSQGKAFARRTARQKTGGRTGVHARVRFDRASCGRLNNATKSSLSTGERLRGAEAALWLSSAEQWRVARVFA